jgi:lipoprotein-releasing system permease protein
MSFEWFVARRYLTARRKQAFISLISGVSIVGVGVGVMALIVALALMTGVQSELRDRIVGSTAHVYIYKMTDGGFLNADADLQRFAAVPGVTAASPAIIDFALMSSSATQSSAVTLKGIDPTREQQVTDLAQAMKSGSLTGLTSRSAGEVPGVVLGAGLAATLGVRVGDRVDVVTPQGTLTPFGPIPKAQALAVVGTFQFGFYEFDQSYGFVSLPTAEHLFRRQGPDLIELRLRRMDDAPALKARLQQEVGAAYQIKDWVDLNGSLYSALWLEKVAISLTIGLIVMVAALNIVASLVLLVMEKSRDIAILRTMGAPARAIRRIFMFQGLAIGLVGTAAGTVLGLAVSYLADRYRLISLPADVYQITYLPFRVLPFDVVFVVISAIAICFLATVYPSRRAGRLDPAEALRNQ